MRGEDVRYLSASISSVSSAVRGIEQHEYPSSPVSPAPPYYATIVSRRKPGISFRPDRDVGIFYILV